MTGHNEPRPIEHIRLLGGRPALDFVNTIHDRYTQDGEDYLSDVARYLTWSEKAGVLGAAEARSLATIHPPASLLLEVRRLREQLHDLFSSRVDGRKPEREALAGLDTWLQRAWRGQMLDPKRADRLIWRPDAIDALLPLKRIAFSALDVLEHCPPERLKRCAAVGECGWLFVDDSKNNTRRWCSMELCGTSAKMRRYRQGAHSPRRAHPRPRRADH